MKKAIGIREFARRLGVSTTTISHAISGHRPVQEETRKMIFEKMREWNYTPSLNARRLVTSSSNLIAFVSEEGHPEEDLYQMQVIRYICQELRKDHYDLLLDLRPSDDKMRMMQLIERVRARGVDGSIYLGRSFTRAELEELSSPQCPCVYADNVLHDPQPNVCYLCVDARDAYRDAFGYLHDKGCKKILLVARHKDDCTWMFWHELLEQSDWSVAADIFTAEDELDAVQKAGEALADQKFDAIIVRTTPQLSGVLMALKQLGIQPGKDVELIGHGDEPRLDAARQPVGICAFSYKHFGEVAVQSLLDMIRTQELNPPVKVIREKFFPFQP